MRETRRDDGTGDALFFQEFKQHVRTCTFSVFHRLLLCPIGGGGAHVFGSTLFFRSVKFHPRHEQDFVLAAHVRKGVGSEKSGCVIEVYVSNAVAEENECAVRCFLASLTSSLGLYSGSSLKSRLSPPRCSPRCFTQVLYGMVPMGSSTSLIYTFRGFNHRFGYVF